MKQKTIQLPKGYLSWSQLSLWLQSPQKYIEQYIYGKKMYESEYLKFGKKFSELLTDLESVTQPELKELLARIPKRQNAEAELDVTYEGIPLKIIFDSADRKGFEEYKTGTALWDAARAKEHGQMKFYTIGFFLETDKKPESSLHWLPTMKTEEGIRLTGELHSFHVSYSEKELLDFGATIIRVAEEISNWQAFEKKVVKI